MADNDSKTSSSTDIENGKSNNRAAKEKLKDIDKKTLMFAGYIFWAMIFVAGGASIVAILSQKKTGTEPQIISSDPLSGPLSFPSVAPSVVLSAAPSAAPSVALSSSQSTLEELCSYDEVFTKLISVFGEENCALQTTTSHEFKCDIWDYTSHPGPKRGHAQFTWKWVHSEKRIPISLIVTYFEGRTLPLAPVEVLFSEEERCNLNEADEILDMIFTLR